MDRLGPDRLAALGAKAGPRGVVGATGIAVAGRRRHRRAARRAELRACCLRTLAVRAGGSGRRGWRAGWGRSAAGETAAPTRKAGCRRWDRSLLLGSCSATELASQAEPRGQEDPRVAPAALGHACAGAEGHLARRVLVETAREAAVRGVLGQVLQLSLVLLGEVDVEVAHPHEGNAVGDQLVVAGLDDGFFDVGRVGGQAQDRPAVADDLAS